MRGSKPAALDPFVGCLLGGAIGDALGYPIEFLSAADVSARFGDSPPRDLTYAGEAVVSDDTQLTLFSAEALVRAHAAGELDPTAFALGAYQRWYATQAMIPGGAPRPREGQGLLLADARLYARRAPGNTCLSALAWSFTRGAAATVRDPPNGSKGCGAVMRAAPFGLVARSPEEAFATARDAAVLTHGHPSGYLSAAYLAAVVHDLARGEPLSDAMTRADALLGREEEHAEVAFAVDRARSVAGPPARRPERPSSRSAAVGPAKRRSRSPSRARSRRTQATSRVRSGAPQRTTATATAPRASRGTSSGRGSARRPSQRGGARRSRWPT
jgi:ADP-ribosylglycohydrolase